MSHGFESQLFLSRPFLTKNQITSAQLSTINDRRTYNQRKLSILTFLSELCVKLELPRRTLETAMYFYQRYHLFNNFETELCYTVATSCLILGCKQVETFKKVNEVATLSLQIRHNNNNSNNNNNKISTEVLESFKKRIYQIELRILEACNFDYRINNNVHIDEFIVKLGHKLSFPAEICQLAWLIAYDVLKLDVILMVPPPIIALSCLRLAFELYDKNAQWPIKSYENIGARQVMVDDIFFHIINFYINAFDLCELKYHIPSKTIIVPPVSIERFIQIKSRVGPECNMDDVTQDQVKYDDFLTKSRQFNVQERRYILSPEMMKEETNASKKQRV